MIKAYKPVRALRSTTSGFVCVPNYKGCISRTRLFSLTEKESTLKIAERELLEEDQPKGKKRKRLPNKLYLNTQEESVGLVAKKKNYKLLAARRSELEVFSQDEPNLSSEDTETLADEIKALKEENQRLREQQSGESSAATKDLESQLKALNKENTRLRKIAVKEIPSLLAAVRTLIADKVTSSSSYEGESEYEASAATPSSATPSPPQPTSPTPPKPTTVKLGNDDSTRVSAHCWETAKAQPTAKGMARTLLLGLFSIDVLLKSNLTGGVNKVDPSAERRQPLDPTKLKALLDAVVQKHPGVKISEIRTALNKRICELRHQQKIKSTVN
ncbi:uncharacterized protein LOC118794019 [Megalops cyprinoides]|uniref:uncharacterized protein LOC118794019 n=1 Tax=Megalops cyprinoides TaxID=118141 RepID=UPI0018654D04|nr:uncharacterized protein LOC118794019 [Megalops cyprinoides]